MPKSVQDYTVACMQGIVEEFAWHTNAPLRGLNFQKTDGGWLLVVKTYSVQRGALVAFCGGATPADALQNMWNQVNTREGLGWKEDKYFNAK